MNRQPLPQLDAEPLGWGPERNEAGINPDQAQEIGGQVLDAVRIAATIRTRADRPPETEDYQGLSFDGVGRVTERRETVPDPKKSSTHDRAGTRSAVIDQGSTDRVFHRSTEVKSRITTDRLNWRGNAKSDKVGLNPTEISSTGYAQILSPREPKPGETEAATKERLDEAAKMSRGAITETRTSTHGSGKIKRQVVVENGEVAKVIQETARKGAKEFTGNAAVRVAAAMARRHKEAMATSVEPTEREDVRNKPFAQKTNVTRNPKVVNRREQGLRRAQEKLRKQREKEVNEKLVVPEGWYD